MIRSKRTPLGGCYPRLEIDGNPQSLAGEDSKSRLIFVTHIGIQALRDFPSYLAMPTLHRLVRGLQRSEKPVISVRKDWPEVRSLHPSSKPPSLLDTHLRRWINKKVNRLELTDGPGRAVGKKQEVESRKLNGK